MLVPPDLGRFGVDLFVRDEEIRSVFCVLDGDGKLGFVIVWVCIDVSGRSQDLTIYHVPELGR